jgi:hypothetical protein
MDSIISFGVSLGSRRRMSRTSPRCYSRHKNAVAGGKTTWAALEAAGQMLPALPPGKVWRNFTVSN